MEDLKDNGLISGADALRALADGEEVEYFSPEYSKEWKSIRELTTGFDIGHFLNDDHEDDDYKFRLKPQTIKLELELPKPFEPKEDGYVYIIDDGQVSGYRKYYFVVEGDNELDFIGVWRTEEEIKQVVEQLRKIKGAV